MKPSFWSKLRRESVQALQVLMLPSVAAFLPWPLAFRLLARFSRWQWLYRDEWRAALAEAKRHVDIPDPSAWAQRYRLGRLVDHADFWLTRLRGNRWIRRYVDREGEFPHDGAAVGMFFHWCAGLWGVRALKAAGHRSSVLAGHFSPASMGAWVAYGYGHLRLRELARSSGMPLIYAPGTVRRAVAVLGEGHWIIGTPDVPPSETRLATRVTAFGQAAWMAGGLAEIARRARVPVVVFSTSIDFTTGRRRLRILPPIAHDDPALMQRVSAEWERLIREQPSGFLLWPFFPAFFRDPDSAPAA